MEREISISLEMKNLFPSLTSSGPAHLHACQQGQLYCAAQVKYRPAVMSPAVSEGQNKLCTVLSSRTQVLTGAMNINIERGCGKAPEKPQPSDNNMVGGLTLSLLPSAQLRKR